MELDLDVSPASYNFENMDSRIFLMHSTLGWGGNAFWALEILFKLEHNMGWSWWVVFVPTWLAHGIFIPLQTQVILSARKIIEAQMDSTPGPMDSDIVHQRYEELKMRRMKEHVITNSNVLLQSISLLIVKIMFCWQLEKVWENDGQWGSFRVMFLPFWLAWLIMNLLSFHKDKASRGYGDVRELQYLFFLFVACKLDGIIHYGWGVVFLVPWVAFAFAFLGAILMLLMLAISRSTFADRLLQVGILCMCLSLVPQFVSYLRLVAVLEGISKAGYAAILVPNIASWVLLLMSSLVVHAGLSKRERNRSRRLLRLRSERSLWEGSVLQVRQASVNYMSDEQLARAARELAMGKVKPRELYRVTASLYRRLGPPAVTETQAESSACPRGNLAALARMTKMRASLDMAEMRSHPLGADDCGRRWSKDGQEEFATLSTPTCSSPSSSPSTPRGGAPAGGHGGALGEAEADNIEVQIEVDNVDKIGKEEEDDRDMCIICCDEKVRCGMRTEESLLRCERANSNSWVQTVREDASSKPGLL
mmetsp:Transcript_23469/g.51307  ORF Transcript_23469/g.51307 Transcript_23469/m.51307 type:complete len:535 (-) Transcript_23469:42-1646(-)